METLRQDHQGTACVGLTPNPSSSSSTSSSTKTAGSISHTCSNSISSTTIEGVEGKEGPTSNHCHEQVS